MTTKTQTIQEEIVSGMEYELRKRNFDGSSLTAKQYVEGIIIRLHSQRVRVMVERGLPSFSDFLGSKNDAVINQVLKAVEFRYKESGYAAFEPLVKEI